MKFLNFTNPNIDIAARIELTVPRRPYNAEFTSFNTFPAITASCSIIVAKL
jgi:hypothetical protein